MSFKYPQTDIECFNEAEIKELHEKFARTPIDWDTELNALQISNDALRAQCEEWREQLVLYATENNALRAEVGECIEQRQANFILCGELRAEVERQQSYVKVADQVEKELRARVAELEEARVKDMHEIATLRSKTPIAARSKE